MGYLVAKAVIIPCLLISHPFPLIMDLLKFGLFHAWLDQALFCSGYKFFHLKIELNQNKPSLIPVDL